MAVRATTLPSPETLKLARLLRVGVDDLPDVSRVAEEDLKAYREQVTDALFAESGLITRLGEATSILPVGVLVSLAEKSFGPLLVARVAGVVPADRSSAVGRKASVPFSAQIAAELDPRRVSELLAGFPAELVVEIAAEMARNGEHVAMGRFVGHLSDTALAGCLDRLTDDDLLRILYVLEEPERLPAIIEMLPRERLHALVRGIVEELDLAQMPALVASIPQELLAELAVDLAAEGDHVVMAHFVAHLGDDDLRACLRALAEEDLLDEAAGVIEVELKPAQVRRAKKLAKAEGLEL